MALPDELIFNSFIGSRWIPCVGFGACAGSTMWSISE
jgi:hypothetical protein